VPLDGNVRGKPNVLWRKKLDHHEDVHRDRKRNCEKEEPQHRKLAGPRGGT